MTRTAALMADPSVPAIFEAAFEHSRVRVRIDVLERLPRGYCHAPYSCEHWERCTASKPANWVFHMPNFAAARRME